MTLTVKKPMLKKNNKAMTNLDIIKIFTARSTRDRKTVIIRIGSI